MTTAHFSAMWATIAPDLGNHLWQSTLFAAAAGLLTLILRKNQARVRYWIWLAASVKFLIPFSLLVSMGSRIGWSHGSAQAGTGLYFVMQEMNQPFTAATVPAISRANPSLVSPNLLHLLPALFLGLWLVGLFLVFCLWWARWRRVSAAMRQGRPLREGREVEALRRVRRIAGLRGPIEMISSPASLEPGIFGIARPVLIWPEGISERLEDAHLEAIVAHEVWHVRRRDNLAAAIHMVVEALFWFHPLVWWLGARLMEERERACDEEVLEQGSERQVYAESILKVCEFCVGSPLACVAGVTGADLKKRMVSIMTGRIARKLNFSTKLLLSAAVMVALAVPIGVGVATATQGRAQAQSEDASTVAPKFEVSVKPSQLSTPTYAGGQVHMVRMMYGPDGFEARNTTLLSIIQEAYGVQANQIIGAPDWVDTTAYDIEVKTQGMDGEATGKMDPANFDRNQQIVRAQLQALLTDRFQLTLHHAKKDLPSYALVVSENGSQLQPTKYADYPDTATGPDGRGVHRMMMQRQVGGEVVGVAAQKTSTAELAQQLSMQLGKSVVDQTGLTGRYDFSLHWAKDAAPDGTSASGPSLFTALQEQLGLKLVPQEGPMPVLVIDHVERPDSSS